MSTNLRVDPVNGQWTCDFWDQAGLEIQEFNLQTVAIKPSRPLAIEITIRSIGGKEWLIRALDPADVAIEIAEGIADGMPDEVAGEIRGTYVWGDRVFVMDTLEGRIRFAPKSPPEVSPIP